MGVFNNPLLMNPALLNIVSLNNLTPAQQQQQITQQQVSINRTSLAIVKLTPLHINTQQMLEQYQQQLQYQAQIQQMQFAQAQQSRQTLFSSNPPSRSSSGLSFCHNGGNSIANLTNPPGHGNLPNGGSSSTLAGSNSSSNRSINGGAGASQGREMLFNDFAPSLTTTAESTSTCTASTANAAAAGVPAGAAAGSAAPKLPGVLPLAAAAAASPSTTKTHSTLLQSSLKQNGGGSKHSSGASDRGLGLLGSFGSLDSYNNKLVGVGMVPLPEPSSGMPSAGSIGNSIGVFLNSIWDDNSNNSSSNIYNNRNNSNNKSETTNFESLQTKR